jgi:GntR family transcriptional regulator, transcriptional repressor for pyruvate dehydrogenase complex
MSGRTGFRAAVEPLKISAVDRLVDEIRAFVAEQGLQVGDALPTERELGERFQASRNTVREALVILRAYGLVETRPKAGAVIAGDHAEAVRRVFAFHNGVSPDSFRDLQGFRRIVETGVGEHIILHATGADFDRLDAVNDELLAADGVEELALADYRFHEALVALGGNRTALATYRLMRPVIVDLMHVGKAARPARAETHETHGRIAAALRARDRIAFAYVTSITACNSSPVPVRAPLGGIQATDRRG